MNQIFFELLLVSPFFVLALYIFISGIPRRGADKFSFERRRLAIHREKDELR